MTTQLGPDSHAIRTPDQRLRVFVSSTLGELAEERRAVRRAIERLHMHPVMFELGARPHPPRALYRAYLEQSHIFIGIYWQSYGWVAPEMDVSGLEDELDLSHGMPRLIYVKGPAPERQPRLKDLLDRIRDADDASYKHFASARELGAIVANDLAVLLTERFERPHEALPAATHEAPALPIAPTRLLGREREVSQVTALLARDDVRLVTLTGPGGIGKTRCATEAASRLAAETTFVADFVALDAIRSAGNVLPAIAGALGVRVEGAVPLVDSLAESLRGRNRLLLLDNLEHVIEAAPDIAALLARCPDLKVLATSRVSLRLRGEHEYQLPPLDTPEPGSDSAEQIEAVPSVQLFVERARDIRPDFELTPENAPAVGEICRRLDGIPLAIELAAARIRLLTPRELLERLGSCLDELTGGATDQPHRQQALRATIEWSYALLNEDECRLFARLGVFTGGWSLDALEAVCRDESYDALQVLSSLAEQSLVYVRHLEAGSRFGMLEVVRAFAVEKLRGSHEYDAMLDRHAAYFLNLAETTRAHIESPDQHDWLHRLEHDNENLRQMVDRFLEKRDVASLARVAHALRTYWWLRDQMPENRRWMETILPAAEVLESELRAWLLFALGFAVFEAGDFDRSKPLLEEAEKCFREAGSASGTAWTLALLGPLQIAFGGSPAHAVRLLAEADEIAAKASDRWTTFYVRTIHANVVALSGDVRRAMDLMQQALDIAREFGNKLHIAHAAVELGIVALLAGETKLARRCLAEGATLLRGLRHREGLSYLLDARGIEAVIAGDLERAGVAFGAATAVREAINLEMWPPIREMRRGYLSQVEEGLDSERLTAATSRGRAMSSDEALEFCQGS